MDIVLSKFADYIGFKLPKSFSDIKVVSAHKENDIFTIHLDAKEIIPFEDFKTFYDCIKTRFNVFDLFISVLSENYTLDSFKKYYHFAFENFSEELEVEAKDCEYVKATIDGHFVHLEVEGLERLFSLTVSTKKLISRFKTLGFNSINIHFEPYGTIVDRTKEAEEAENRKKEAMAILNTSTPRVQKEVDYKKHISKNFKNSAIKIAEAHESYASNVRNVTLCGEMYSYEMRPTKKTDFYIITFEISDYSEAIPVKYFCDGKGLEAFESDFKEGDFLEINGELEIDAFAKNQLVLKTKTIKKATSILEVPEDNEVDKRVELSVRSRMTTMDSVIDLPRLIARAEKYGHEAIALVDLNSVQAYPEFTSLTKKTKLKPIFGATFTTLEKNHNAIFNHNPKTILSSDEYVVFDFETTGLYPIFNHIIEFGAVKIKNGRVVNKIQFFVNPGIPVPDKITDITNITTEMVKDGLEEKAALEKIIDYIGEATLVAHNAKFDLSFLNEKLHKNKMPVIKNAVIDSMIVARIVLPNEKRFRLENFATKMGVEYDSSVAHRADYDADVLARAWLVAVDKLKEHKIVNQGELYNFHRTDLYEKAFKDEVTVLAKNQEGLMEIFKYISQCSTTQFYREGVVFIEDLVNKQNTFLGSSSLRSRLLNKVLGGTKLEAIEEMKKYDYIEIQPMQNFLHLFEEQFGPEEYIWMTKFIINEAKKLKIPVVATGDVRYIDKHEKTFHTVYIHAKQIGGGRHYLFNYKGGSNPIYPDQHFLTTDQMLKAFEFLPPELAKEIVVTNTQNIARQIEKCSPIRDKLYTPKMKGADESLIEVVYKNARAIYGENLPDIIKDRIEVEIKPLQENGYLVIYWIAHLLVAKSLRDGYLVGSRGSVGSSLVATFANITEVNPLPPHYVCKKCKFSEFFPNSSLNSGFDLPEKKCECGELLHRDGQKIPFETFLGFGADKVPDIDLNFSGDYQPIIHDEVKVLFGETHSLRAGTISTVANKTAYGFVLAYEEETNKSYSSAFKNFIAKKMEGTKRTTGQHPGGIIVIPKEYDVEYFTPVNYPANDVNSSWLTTHFDFHSIHDNVLKLDLLGHDDPTAIKLLEELTGLKVDIINMSDQNVIKLFSSTEPLGITPDQIYGETTGAMGIPEFGTTFVRNMLKAVNITTFGELIAISGLSHGTDVWANNAEILVKRDKKTLKEIISCRDDIMNDLINKGMAPKISFDIMERVRKGKSVTPEQEELLKKHDVEPWYIDSLKKIKYMFPKAHATAYVTMAYRIAWFKLYYPLAYYATYFTTRADVFDIKTIGQGQKAIDDTFNDFMSRKNIKFATEGKVPLTNKESDLIPILELAKEALVRGIKIENISLERSDYKTWIIDKENNSLIPPFSSIDGFGEAGAISIIKARNQKHFTSIQDFMARTSVNKTILEVLKSMNVLKQLPKEEQISFDLFDED